MGKNFKATRYLSKLSVPKAYLVILFHKLTYIDLILLQISIEKYRFTFLLTEVLISRYRYDDDGSGNEVPSNVNNNNSPPAAPYEKKLKLDMTTRKYSSDVENDTENGSDLIGKLLGIPDKTIINKLLSSADEAAKFLGVNK